MVKVGYDLWEVGEDPKFNPFGLVTWTRKRAQRKRWKAIRQAVRLLYELGESLSIDLFDDDTWQAGEFFNRACGAWKSLNPEKVEYLPVIEVNASVGDIVPIEFLPLLNPAAKPPESISDVGALEQALRPFVGFSTVVKRNFDMENRELEELPNSGRLPVKFFRYPKLACAGQEFNWLKENELIDLDGPWPNDEAMKTKDFASDLARHIWVHDGQRFDGTFRDSPFQVLHFACHCDTTEDDTDSHSLIFDDGKDFEVSQLDLKSRRKRYLPEILECQDDAHPLIFLNACGSSVVDPSGVTSFPELFLEHGSCGFIGTEAAIPDEVSEAFSAQFYSAFMEGRPLGMAVQLAKMRLLRDHRNPLGILYTIYANPDMRVQNREFRPIES